MTKIPDGDHSLTLFFNPFWRDLARYLTSKCEKCGQERLFSVFDAYSSSRHFLCESCLPTSTVLMPLVHLLFFRLGVNDSMIKRLLKDSLIRKCMLNVVEGIANFGIRYPQPTGAPITIVWNFTNRCNLSCLHCHQDSSSTSSHAELTTSQAFKVIDNMSDAGVVILTFSGGEPLLRRDLYDVIKRANDNGMLCTIASNGTLITPKVAKKLAKVGIKRVEIGLDGARAETHDFLRNKLGSFEATIEGIRNCAAVGFDELATTMTLHSKNIHELEETINLAEKLGATRFYLNRLIPAGRGIEACYLDVTAREKIEALEALYNKFYKSVTEGFGMQCYARGMTYYTRLGYERSKGKVFTVSEALSGYERMFQEKFGLAVSNIVRKLATGFGGCSAGLTYAGVTASGDLIPCVPASSIKLGNLLEQSLEEIWINNELLNYIRNRKALKGSCRICAYSDLCGGCRYTAYVTRGDWLGPDASCPFGPKILNA
ncbi:MAG: pyrroloquinoline quinone biosynthesis protein PqqE [Candidatus Bathyarchaeota archaeon BA2]|nr:MAG: pyrroloquinoline quinone biosynthesis protein PqqE [Candidatus Bathyarchaeota archaeon BA2]